MAHHHHAPNHSHTEGMELRHVNVHSIASGTHELNHSSHEVEMQKENAPSHEKMKNVFEYRIAGFPWPFVLVMSVIAIGFLTLVLKIVGVY
jgi:hypothetical protein